MEVLLETVILIINVISKFLYLGGVVLVQLKNKARSPFSSRLTQLRRNSGMTQREVAQYLSIDRSTYAYYETDKTRPDFETLCRMARMFRVSTDYLLGREDELPDTVEVHDTPLTLEGPAETVPLSALTEEERAFVFLYREMTAEQKNALLEFAMTTLHHLEKP